jgi:beta-carotene 3-hydroxylase
MRDIHAAGACGIFIEDHHQPKYEHPFERNDIFYYHASLNRALFFAEAGFNYLFLLVWAYLPMVSTIS